jgi:hypothetical protein
MAMTLKGTVFYVCFNAVYFGKRPTFLSNVRLPPKCLDLQPRRACSLHGSTWRWNWMHIRALFSRCQTLLYKVLLRNENESIYRANASTGKFLLLLTLSDKGIPAMRLLVAAHFVLSTLTRHSFRNNNSSLVTRVLIFQQGKGRGKVQFNGRRWYFKNLISYQFCVCKFQIFLTLPLWLY